METNKWKMNRAGLINFWYYDEEIFDSSDGRLLLRGSNGSGKSVTMQSFLPVLLDGKKSPDRLDPFGSKARRMEDYLLGEKDVGGRDERTGYLFIEYKKELSNQYITTGIGLQAKRHKEMKFWGFVITDNRRIGQDFQLYQTHHSDKIPLSVKELENRLGNGGQVVRSQREYMALVNKYVFGFQSLDSYEELIKLLIQLRSPKLSKDFRPTVIYEILESALPPLADDDLRHLSDTIENMDQARQQLEQLEREQKSAAKLVSVYDQYNRYLLAQKAESVLKTEDRFKIAQDNKMAAERAIKELSEEIGFLEDSRSKLDIRKRVAQGERDRLSRHEVWTLQETLTKTEQHIQALKQDLLRKREQLDYKKRQERQQQVKLDETEANINHFIRETDEYIQEMNVDARDSGFSQHEVNVADFNRAGKGAFDFTVWQKEVSEFTSLLEEVKDDFVRQKQYSDEMERKYKESSELKEAIDKMRNEQSDYEKLFESDKQKLEEKIYRWIKEHEEFAISEEMIREISRAIQFLYETSSFEHIKSFISDSVQGYQEKLLSQKAVLKSGLRTKLQRNADLEEEKLQWENMTDPEPERAEATRVYRESLKSEGKAFIPFYAAVEFHDQVTDQLKERVEAALGEAGILDSLIVPENDGIQDDRCIVPNPSMMGHTLADYLKPDIDNCHHISQELIDDVLRSILIEDPASASGDGNMCIDENGRYRLGGLLGHAPSYGTSRFIGRSSRKRYQQEKIRELEAEIEKIRLEISQYQKGIEQFEHALSISKTWREHFPSDQDLQEIDKNIRQISYQLKEKQHTLAKVDEHYKTAVAEFQFLKQKIKVKTVHVLIKKDLQSFQEALRSIKSYREFLNKLDKTKNSITHSYREQETLLERLEEIQEEIMEGTGLYNIQGEEINKTAAEIQTIHNQLKLKGIDEVRTRIKEVQDELSEVESSLDRVKNDLPTKLVQKEQLKKDLEVIVRELEFWTLLLKNWQEALAHELSNGFIQEIENHPKEISQRFMEDYRKYDRQKVSEQLTKTYFNEQPQLMEYKLTEYDRSHEEPVWFKKEGWTEEHRVHMERWSQQNRRKIMVMEYHGQKVSPYFVSEALNQELRNQQLWLDEQDRNLYEDIILKSVGGILRTRIQRAERWVKQMNTLMESRNSSSGLTFSIAWKPLTAESETEMDTKELVGLLQMNSKFLTEENLEKITRHFQSKILRAKDIIELRNEGNTLHQVLKEVLDYRKWFSFVLSYRREREPKREMTNNAFYKFSGGEKAMAMYIPLFTAAYSRYQEAESDAPYIISLDEAFAGVDENNIRDMFEVVEELGFNFIMNSQALWGDYETISNLSICELVRPKNADFVTVIRYHWDGKTKNLLYKEPILQE
ncbi:TIGR02680 family protein [Peribacillus deserti]|uniref:TIGR02680 family protein n=1 Tax=Peribacillus deserti TaxID=673318 RepID=A0A2N5M5I5_9BACI|nr:TIGR02680 family protein [Peribacillus deserti]PLT29628.1 TIGR02680 family protein [Peribacillus deserti]